MSIMVDEALLAQVKEMDAADRLELISEVWQTFDAAELPVTADERVLLDDRLRDLANDPNAHSSWSNVRSRLGRRLV